MLPDFPSIKSDLDNLATQRLRERVKQGDPVISMIGRTLQHEGRKHSYTTEEGKAREVDYQKSEAAFSISRSEMKSLTLKDIIDKLDQAAEEMTGQVARVMFAAFEESTKEAGTRVDAGGQPLTPPLLLEALEKMRIDFDEETGQPHLPTIVVHPQAFAKIREKLPEWEKDEEYKRRYQEIMKRKYDEWYARESNRKLAD